MIAEKHRNQMLETIDLIEEAIELLEEISMDYPHNEQMQKAIKKAVEGLCEALDKIKALK